jgi:hypothetical protein
MVTENLMSLLRWPCLFVLSTFLVSAADDSWKNKQIAEWSQEDAKQVLSDSPWVKTATPTVSRSASESQRRSGGAGRGGIGVGGVGIGLPGIGGMGRRGGIGGPGTGGGGYPRGGQTGGGQTGGTNDDLRVPETLTLRWESALPVRGAELKTHDPNAPIVDEDAYAIAVYGIPYKMTLGDPEQLKKQSTLKRDGKKDIKPSRVEVLQKDDGPVVVYLFPKTKEITKDDRKILFDAEIGRMKLGQSFYLDDMVYQGKREL